MRKKNVIKSLVMIGALSLNTIIFSGCNTPTTSKAQATATPATTTPATTATPATTTPAATATPATTTPAATATPDTTTPAATATPDTTTPAATATPAPGASQLASTLGTTLKLAVVTDKNGPTFTFSEPIYEFRIAKEEDSTQILWSIKNTNPTKDKDIATITYGTLPDGWKVLLGTAPALETGKNYTFRASTRNLKVLDMQQFAN